MNRNLLIRPRSNTGAERQTKIMADYIMGNIPGEPSQDEGAGDCAVRLLDKYMGALIVIMRELGTPGEGYPTPTTNAYEIAYKALFS